MVSNALTPVGRSGPGPATKVAEGACVARTIAGMTDHSISAPARNSAVIDDPRAFAVAAGALQNARGDLARAQRVSVPSSENFNCAFDHFDLLPADRRALIVSHFPT